MWEDWAQEQGIAVTLWRWVVPSYYRCIVKTTFRLYDWEPQWHCRKTLSFLPTLHRPFRSAEGDNNLQTDRVPWLVPQSAHFSLLLAYLKAWLYMLRKGGTLLCKLLQLVAIPLGLNRSGARIFHNFIPTLAGRQAEARIWGFLKLILNIDIEYPHFAALISCSYDAVLKNTRSCSVPTWDVWRSAYVFLKNNKSNLSFHTTAVKLKRGVDNDD